MSNNNPRDDLPDKNMKVSIFPPGHFLGSFLASGLCGYYFETGKIVEKRSSSHLTVLGMVGIAASLATTLTAFFTFKKAKTPVPHGFKVQTIVQHGIFAYSRNPIYLGFVGAVGSMGLAMNSWLGMLVPSMYLFSVIHLLVIPKEEKYLEEHFGKEYIEYKAKVPRWVFF